jgi:hypothetical protein
MLDGFMAEHQVTVLLGDRKFGIGCIQSETIRGKRGLLAWLQHFDAARWETPPTI